MRRLTDGRVMVRESLELKKILNRWNVATRKHPIIKEFA